MKIIAQWYTNLNKEQLVSKYLDAIINNFTDNRDQSKSLMIFEALKNTLIEFTRDTQPSQVFLNDTLQTQINKVLKTCSQRAICAHLVADHLAIKYLQKLVELMSLSTKYFILPSVGVDLTIHAILKHGSKQNEHSQRIISIMNKFLNNQKMRDAPMPG